MQMDAIAMLYGRQRPPYAGASSIGAWAHILELLCYVAIVTNVAMLGVTSQALQHMCGQPSRAHQRAPCAPRLCMRSADDRMRSAYDSMTAG